MKASAAMAVLFSATLAPMATGCGEGRRGTGSDAGSAAGAAGGAAGSGEAGGSAGGFGGAGAGAGGAGTAGDDAASSGAGSGGTGGEAGSRAGSGGSQDGGVDASAGAAGSCPPCVPPPSPDCVGTGPCGCGPYLCPDAGGSSHGLQCDSTGGAFPAFDKSCGDAGDCVVLVHQTDCCGSAMMVGVAASDQVRFQSAEAQCSSTFPLCDCASLPPVAEDGNRAGAADAFIAVCQGGECSSTVDPARISQGDLALCQQDEDCIVVPHDHCCGSTKTAINQRYLDVYNDHPQWQVFNDPATCAVIGMCPDDSAVDSALCEGAPQGYCQLDFN